MATAAFIGNFEQTWCSEVHWARELRYLGWHVEQFQEPRPSKDGRAFLKSLESWCEDHHPELVIYTRTYGLPAETTAIWRRLQRMGITTCSFHLDLYVGLEREADIGADPFWTTQYVFTADGDAHSAEIFKERGVNHYWSSPAVVSDECNIGHFDPQFDYDVVFTGSSSYHGEWPWRPKLIEFLSNRYGERFHLFNQYQPEGPIRGSALNDLCATARVVVGDSLVLPGHTNYWSDRYFEILGRGGFLVAPQVPGLQNFLIPGVHYMPYQHPRVGFSIDLALSALGNTIDYWLDHPEEREAIRHAGYDYVRQNQTYRDRWQRALQIMDLDASKTISTALSYRPEAIERLELGSGYHPTKGFTHLDLNPEAPGVDIVGSAWPLQLEDDSVGEIRAVDVLEHLSYWDTTDVLADWFRVLVPGGKLFVQVPDAETIMDWYFRDPQRLVERLPAGLPRTPLSGATWRLLGGHNDGNYVKQGQDFRLNAHYALFSAGSLRSALEEAGFTITKLSTNPHPNLLCNAVKPAPQPVTRIRERVQPVEKTKTDIKIGLIARNEIARGLALMTKGFYDHIPVDRVLIAKMPSQDCALGIDWYPGATEIEVQPGYRLDENTVRDWLDGLDVVYTAETPYDWRMPTWCRKADVRLVVHGMPEFVRHGQPNALHMQHPDEWWWPTSWRLDHVPAGPVVPVPMPDHEPTAAPVDDREFRVYHIAGKRAAADRNGTDTVIEALRGLDRRTVMTMFGLEGSLPNIDRPRNLDLVIDNLGPADRWDMHRNQHLLVLPRRYAGLCLPALEAMSRGIAVMMPDVPPNRELASVLVPPTLGKSIRVPNGRIATHTIHFFALSQEINALNKDRDRLGEAMKQAYEKCPRWSTYRQVYLDHFRRICS